LLLLAGAFGGYAIYSAGHSSQDQTASIPYTAVLATSAPAIQGAEQVPVVADKELQDNSRSPGKKSQRKRPLLAIPSLPVIAADLTIDSSPPGAHIQLDGAVLGSVTPYTVSGLGPGEHQIILTRAGYAVEHRTVRIQAAEKASLVVPLTELPPRISIFSQPVGASIFLDGKDTGRVTPLVIAVRRGSHTITVAKNGFFQETNTVELTSGQNYEFAPRLTPMGRAEEIRESGSKLKRLFGGTSSAGMIRVQIRSNPKGAQISVNQRILNKVTPAELFFPEGVYEITLTAAGYKPVHKTINVGTSNSTKIEERLERIEP
jgi:hypothetical protein